MDSQFSFFYPIIEETQIDFEGRTHIHEVFCEGHILFNSRLMCIDICKETMDDIMKRVGAKKKKILPRRTPKGLCPTCLEQYKNNPDSAYYRFTHATPIKVTSTERPLVSG